MSVSSLLEPQMSPNLCEMSASPRFVPSLACIAEEEPKVVAIRRITVPDSHQVKIPVFDVNIYLPRPLPDPIPVSIQRLLTEMDSFIDKGSDKNAEKHKEMAKSLRKKVAVEQAEKKRLETPNFTDRDWYWYAEKTGNFVDEPITVAKSEKIDKPVITQVMFRGDKKSVDNDNVFDLEADF